MIQWQILMILISLAVMGTAYSWNKRDENNYTDIIGGFAATVFWIISGMSFFAGVLAEDVTYVNQFTAWLFIALGIIQALIMFIRSTELFKEN